MWRLYSIITTNKALFLILLIASLVRFVGLIPNIANTDEGYILKNARLLFYGIATNGDFDPHAYKYGSIIFYLQSLVYIPFYLVGLILVTTGLAHPPPKIGVPVLDFLEHIGSIWEDFFLWEARAITAIFGILSVLMVYLLVKKLFGQKFGLLASFIFAVNPFHVRDSHYATTDVLMLFFILLSLLLMVYVFTTSKLKWYIISGLVIGISTTIKYFPLTILAFPVAVLMDKKKRSRWLVKIFIGVIFIFIGFLLGVPFLFLHPENKNLLEYEVGRELLWYGTTLTNFLAGIVSYFASAGRTEFPSPSLLVPTEFTEFHSSFLIFKIFGPILMLAALVGIFCGLIRFTTKTLFLLVIPVFTFLYISFYIPAVFERLSLPVIPFLSIFAAVFLISMYEFIATKISKRLAVFIFVLFGTSSLYYPVTTSFASSWSCGTERSEVIGKRLIDQNVSLDKKIAYIPPIYLPGKTFTHKPEETRPDHNFFLAELQKEDVDYFFVNTGLFTRFTYHFENNFFNIPQILYENYYVPLAMKELATRAVLLGSFARHPLCEPSQFFYYEIPKPDTEAMHLISSFTFDDEASIKSWLLEDLNSEHSRINVKFDVKEGHNRKGALAYGWTNLYYRGPRFASERINVVPNEIYTFKGWVKPQISLADNERDAFLRIDFFEDDNSNVLLPGKVVALSPRVFGEAKWQELEVTARAPLTAKFAVFSINIIGTKSVGGFYFDDFYLFGPSAQQ